MIKVLIIQNYSPQTTIKYFDNNIDKFKTTYIHSNDTSLKNDDYVKQKILENEFIIIGGGPQHLTTSQINKYAEVDVLANIVKICDEHDKVLIGLCLGCQVIGHAYGLEIVTLDKYCIGTKFLDISSISNEFYEDEYLKRIDVNLLYNAFSNHHDGILDTMNTDIRVMGYSIYGVPYIVKHKTKKIYGFQMHPESSYESINYIIALFNINYKNDNYSYEISKNFFDAFLKK
jgi:anthranilate/para-aminobenzoate synthase component II